MKNRNGEVISSCCMTDGVKKYGNCGTCMYLRGWWNTSYLHEPHAGEPDNSFCCDESAVIEV